MEFPTLELPGRLSQTRTRHGDPNSLHTIRFDGETLYKLQSMLEQTATHADDYFTTRDAVLLAEHIRTQLAKEKPDVQRS